MKVRGGTHPTRIRRCLYDTRYYTGSKTGIENPTRDKRGRIRSKFRVKSVSLTRLIGMIINKETEDFRGSDSSAKVYQIDRKTEDLE